MSPPSSGFKLSQSEIEAIGLTPTLLEEALLARKWLISQQARMNWAVLSKKMVNHYHYQRVDFLHHALEKHEAEKELEIHERLLLKGKRRAQRLEIHRKQVANNRSRATEQILSAAAVIAFDQRPAPTYISQIPNDVTPTLQIPPTQKVIIEHNPLENNINSKKPSEKEGRLLHTANVDLGTVPETQREYIHSYPVQHSVDSHIPHPSMGYFPARIMRMEKKDNADELDMDQNEILYQRQKVRKKKLKKRRKKRLAKNKRDHGDKKPSSANEAKEYESKKITRNEKQTDCGKVMRSMLKHIETNPTFTEVRVEKYGGWTDDNYDDGYHNADRIDLINPVTLNRNHNIVKKQFSPRRPHSARARTKSSGIRRDKMFVQMSNGSTNPVVVGNEVIVSNRERPKSARIHYYDTDDFDILKTKSMKMMQKKM